MKKPVWRTAIGRTAFGCAVLAGVLAVATPAAAHVTVNPREAGEGSYARVDFRVPNESDTESTVKVEVHFPEDTPFPSVSVAPVPGWDVEVSRRTLDEPIEGGHGEVIQEVVETITWTVQDDAAAIHPGEFREFPVSMGPVPQADVLHFPALQTYSDGEVVRWIELPAEGAHAEYPAPGLQVVAGSDDHGAASDGADPAEGAEAAGAVDDAGSDEGSGATMLLAIIGLVAGLAGLVLGGLAFTRTRQQ